MNVTPKIIDESDKPLNTPEIENKKVDINVLKARAKAIKDKESLKNKITILCFLLIIGIVGLYFSV